MIRAAAQLGKFRMPWAVDFIRDTLKMKGAAGTFPVSILTAILQAIRSRQGTQVRERPWSPTQPRFQDQEPLLNVQLELTSGGIVACFLILAGWFRP